MTSAEAFVSEFRTGAYNLYGIFAEKEKLPTDFQGEVSEAVYRGEGLLVAGLHDHRDSKIELPLGINATGKHNDALAVVVEDTLFAPADSAMILLDESVMRVELNGAQAAARFQLGGNQDDADIATAFFDYGQGRSVFASMDLLVQAVEAGNGSLYEELILRGFNFAYNPDSSQSSGSAAPLNLVLTNEGIATSGQVILTLPAGSELLDASADFGQEEGPYIWPFELAEAESITLLLWVSMPVDAGEFVAQVQTGVPGDWEDYESISLTLTPEEGVEAVQVGAELSALNLADPDTYHIASQAMDRALGYLEDMDYESALRELLKATLELDDVSNTEADAVRLSLSRLVRQVAFDLQQQPSP